MATELRYIDLEDDSDLARLADEVRATNEPRFLRRDGKPIAIITPVRVSKRKPRRKMTEEEREREFRASFGGWKDVNTEQLLRDIYEHREMSAARYFPFDDDVDASR